jgi:TonB family protein
MKTMRSLLIATLALTPALLYAQAIVPAQPQTTGHAPALQSKLIAPETLAADRTTTPAVRVSTGVIAPKLIHSVAIPAEVNAKWQAAGKYRSAVVEMRVDETGKPFDLKIVQSAGRDLDDNVLAAVSQYRFEPATLGNKAIPINMALTLDILNPLRP